MTTFHESQSFSPIENGSKQPKKFLIIRLHALGDVAITFPAAVSLRKQFPHATIDFLTHSTASPLLDALDLFDTVHLLERSGARAGRISGALMLGLQLRSHNYDTVIDLQRNWVSRLIRRMIRPEYWGEFDRFSPELAGNRVLETYRRMGFSQIEPIYKLPVKNNIHSRSQEILVEHGWNQNHSLIILNPAGLWETRNWPLQNYIDLANIWLESEPVQFLLLGTERMFTKTNEMKKAIGSHLINLTGKTTLAEALGILQHATLVISEDSGLMHMAWVSGIPTLALFGSSNHQWSAPMGPHSACLSSSDLPCGACMQSTCKFGDTHCLTRYSPHMVFEHARQLLRNSSIRYERIDSK